jgi:hypothetical protein
MFKAESLELLARSRRPRLRDRTVNQEGGARAPVIQEHNDTASTEGPDDSIDPGDLGVRLVVRVAEPNVEKIYPLPPPTPLLVEMPASWWVPLLFGKPDDVVSLEDSRLALALIEARLGEYQDSGQVIKREPGATVSACDELPTTVGALHNRIEELYGSRGWRVFQALYHEAVGLHPRPKTAGSEDAVTKGDATAAAPDKPDLIDPVVHTGRRADH